MENARLCLLCLLGSGLILLGTPEPVPGLRPALSPPGHSREETELVEVLQEVLDKLRTREPPALEKRLSWVPWVGRGWGSPGGFGGTPNPPVVWGCSPGADGAAPQCEPREPCAVRRGARIGKLCSCPRGTSCNLLILKCS
ncbi:cocaine- and amphetamine-regulated transcript protein-like isoform X1 [Poecile atricapillus]|uniref:cocaine- and amphetamine-regulated transcript protein-like isoform X1 n=1 Tax=Poecile atricapillus TaxID=48891 RepID=UPI00273930EB|nr:cocaine- and amphetamine-regulated transcript protein-like isoform X1 [Poecile atricapillus]